MDNPVARSTMSFPLRPSLRNIDLLRGLPEKAGIDHVLETNVNFQQQQTSARHDDQVRPAPALVHMLGNIDGVDRERLFVIDTRKQIIDTCLAKEARTKFESIG